MTVEPGTSMEINGKAGGLFNTLKSADGKYITLEEIKLANLSMTVGSGSAFLAMHGENLAANIVDYSCSEATVTLSGSGLFKKQIIVVLMK